ncbi:MAG: SUMF1/EgtB/PvdO family nonheme iron enzyme, partial [Spirochaetales bacterium]|nr:SUMF1/EgtB/PvdO family nonheme iron enzyme [Spirochaetales bacterium]
EGSVTLYAIWKNNADYVNASGNIVIGGNECVKTSMATVSEQLITGSGSEGVFVDGRIVWLSSYSIGKYPVTQQLYKAVVGYNPSQHQNNTDVGETSVLLRPVECVNWYHAITFCNKLSLMMGKTPCYSVKVDGIEVDWANYTHSEVPLNLNSDWNNAVCDWDADGYRLPTEAEWECAARGGDVTDTENWNLTYAGSNDYDSVAWHSGNSIHAHEWEVGLKNPNSLGLYDMSGNVCDYCWDWYNLTEIITSNDDEDKNYGVVINPFGTLPGSNFLHVTRGGTWFEDGSCCSVTTRNLAASHGCDDIHSFRITCSGE